MTSLSSLKSMKEEESQAYLLADLQAEQKKETTYLLAGLLEKVRYLCDTALATGRFDNINSAVIISSYC